MRYTVLMLFSFLAINACRFNPDLQGKGSDLIQGTWHESSMPYQQELLQHTSHNFRFTCDSFYVTLTTTARANIYPDSCYNNGTWVEYAKGTYVTNNDTLVLKGTFTKSNFRQKISGCYRIGTYKPFFIIRNKSDSLLILQNLQSHVSLSLKLKEKSSCIPKPLN